MKRAAGHGKETGAADYLLPALLEVSEALSDTLELRAALHAVLAVLTRQRGVMRSMVRLIDPEGEELIVEAGLGLPIGGRAARLGADERGIGQDVQRGVPRGVRGAGGEPGFGNRAARYKRVLEGSLVSAPIVIDRRAVGTLVVDVSHDPGGGDGSTLDLISIVGAMIGQAAKRGWLAEAERIHLAEDNMQLREELRSRYAYGELLGGSGQMRQLYTQITRVAQTNAAVLVRGETGTGKELIARAIHLASARAEKPYLVFNCAAPPRTLLESELFGHEADAFPGARTRKIGLFERTSGGTIFLDEIGDLDARSQAKLLHLIEKRAVQPLGGGEPVAVDVRVIAATRRDLEAAVADSTFREDLYHRLDVLCIFVPPLHERKADVLLLADHFTRRYAAEYGKEIRRITPPAVDLLTRYHWPGNVRELENTIIRAVVLCDDKVVHPHHLPPNLQTAETSDTVTRGSFADQVTNFERNLIEDTLTTTRGNRARAAQLLMTTERILGYRIRRYGIDWRRFRNP